MMNLDEKRIFEEKVRAIDYLFDRLDLNELQKQVEAQKVVDILKGTSYFYGPLISMMYEHQQQIADISTLKTEIQMLKNELKVLISLVDRPYDYQAQSNMASLKQKYNIY